MIRSLHFSKAGVLRLDLNPAVFTSVLGKPDTLLWVDLGNEPHETTTSLLMGTFGLDPLVAQDMVSGITSTDRIDDWRGYILAVLGVVDADYPNGMRDAGGGTIDMLCAVLGDGFLITHHTKPLDIIDRKWEFLQLSGDKTKRNSYRLFCELMGEIIDGYANLARQLDIKITNIRLEKPSRNQSEQIMKMRENANDVRRKFDGLRLLIDRLARGEFEIIDKRHRELFREVYERTFEIRNEFLRLEDSLPSRQSPGSSSRFSRLMDPLRRTGNISTPIQAENSYELRSIFISYRRSDSADVTGRIYDQLIAYFGRHVVFKDVDSIRLGSKFNKELESALKMCKVVLAVIGKQWTMVSDNRGLRRLDNPEDYVRIEIESSLARAIPIIPILVQGAEMPSEQELPPSLANLIVHQGLRVRPDPDFHNDINRLISHLEQLIK